MNDERLSDALTPDEIDALMSTVADGLAESESAQGAAVVYNFKKPNRVSQEQMRSLHRLHETHARSLEFAFSTLLRQRADVSVVSVVQLAYEEFLGSLPTPTCFSVIGIHDHKSSFALEIDLDTIFPIIDRLLGGRGAKSTTKRELTELEWTLADRVVGVLLGEYRKAWRPVRDMDFHVHVRESNPTHAPMVGPNEPALLVILRVEFGAISGTMNICFPLVTLEPLLEDLDPKNWLARQIEESSEDCAASMRAHVDRARLRVAAHLGDARISVRDLVGLREGDLLRLGVSVHDEIGIFVNGIEKLAARPVSRAGMKAVRITRAARGVA
jgi:flagellar motor switch protein FliM